MLGSGAKSNTWLDAPLSRPQLFRELSQKARGLWPEGLASATRSIITVPGTEGAPLLPPAVLQLLDRPNALDF